ncbi:MAG: hypothetical protein P8L68_00310 [Paracoccaceae bacterium]|nr:hypothetical protein [Paracoccaceae bacterium]MDG1738901.1 hypothetical protein [Paracoccaceae bacterium]MDG2256927.1 hypothetical protein [Paracoccaceae bacterium]
MRLAFRTLQAFLTAAILVIGTLQMAYASGQAPTVGELVLCTGHGAVTIGIDAEGNPTGEIFYCPECASTALVAVQSGHIGLPAHIAISTEISPTHASSMVAIAATVPHPARGPPVPV